jgi:hypothetical protein
MDPANMQGNRRLRARLKCERGGAKRQRSKEFNLFSSSRFRVFASSRSHLKFVTRQGASHPRRLQIMAVLAMILHQSYPSRTSAGQRRMFCEYAAI